MELNQQVCSLELAKQLKELGVKQDSLIYWLNVKHRVHLKIKENGDEVEKDENGRPIIDKIDYRIELGCPFACNIDEENRWSAFTLGELVEILPAGLELIKKDNDWICRYRESDIKNNHCSYGKTAANAAAQILIFLIENKLMELPESPK